MTTKTITHWIPGYSLNGPRGTVMAVCGLYVDPLREHSTAPSCPDCQRLIAEDDASLAALQQWNEEQSR